MYAIYSNDVERIIALEENIWIALQAAKLLSSKISTCICDIGYTELTNKNCYQWTIVASELPLSVQYPKFVPLDNYKVEFAGDPLNTDMEYFKIHQTFCVEVIRILYAAKITDAILNSGDRKYFSLLLENNTISSAADESGIPNGFLYSIEKILYTHTNISDILNSIGTLFDINNSVFPRNLIQYKTVFYKYLNE